MSNLKTGLQERDPNPANHSARFALAIFEDANKCDERNYLVHALELYKDGLKVMPAIVPVPKKLYGKRYYFSMMNFYDRRARRIERHIREIVETARHLTSISIPNLSDGYGYDIIYGQFLTQGDLTQAIIEEPRLQSHEDFDNLLTFIETLMKHSPNLEFVLVNTKRLNYLPHNHQKQFMRTLLEQLNDEKLALKFKFDNTNSRRVIMNNGYIIECDRGLHVYASPPSTDVPYLGKCNLTLRQCLETNYNVYTCDKFTEKLP